MLAVHRRGGVPPPACLRRVNFSLRLGHSSALTATYSAASAAQGEGRIDFAREHKCDGAPEKSETFWGDVIHYRTAASLLSAKSIDFIALKEPFGKEDPPFAPNTSPPLLAIHKVCPRRVVLSRCEIHRFYRSEISIGVYTHLFSFVNTHRK